MKNKETYLSKFHELLKNNLKEIDNKEKIAIAFSGGIDSTLMAKLMKDANFNIACYVVGIENCQDFLYAEKAAKEVNIKLKKIILKKEDIEKAIKTQTKILQEVYKKNKNPELPHLNPNPVSVSYNLPLFFVAKYAKEKYIVICHGPDDFLLNSDEKAKDELDLTFKIEVPQNEATIKHFGKTLLTPYLTHDLSKFCFTLPHKLKSRKEKDKYILRELAKNLGLSDEIAFRKRKSAQYGSGIMKVMKKIAKDKGIRINEYLKGNYQ